MGRIAPWIVAVVLLASTAVLGTFLPAWEPADVEAPTRTAVARVCPAAVADSADKRLGAWAEEPGVAAAPLGDDADPVAPEGITWAAPTEPVRVLLPVTGSASASAVAWADQGPERGLSAVACAAPRTSSWFVAVRSDADHGASVELVNLDATQAEVALTFYGPQGRIAAPGSRGITVPAQGSRSVALVPLLDSDQPVTVLVEATAGRIASYVRVHRWDSTTPMGTDWIPPAAEPAATTIVPGVPGGAGERSLVLVNPGERVVQADIEILSDAGAYQPVGAEGVDIPAESTRVVNLAPGLAGQPGSIRVKATGELTAAVETLRGGDDAANDSAVFPGAVALGGGGAVVWPGPTNIRRSLVLANPEKEPATVRVVTRGVDGKQISDEEVVVPADGSVDLASSGAGAVVWDVSTTVASVVGVLSADGDIGEVGGSTSLALSGDTTGSDTPTLTADPFTGV